ncbi:hypothetical protein NKH18_42855 [Streptomyces sp. M10(2022)]
MVAEDTDHRLTRYVDDREQTGAFDHPGFLKTANLYLLRAPFLSSHFLPALDALNSRLSGQGTTTTPSARASSQANTPGRWPTSPTWPGTRWTIRATADRRSSDCSRRRSKSAYWSRCTAGTGGTASRTTPCSTTCTSRPRDDGDPEVGLRRGRKELPSSHAPDGAGCHHRRPRTRGGRAGQRQLRTHQDTGPHPGNWAVPCLASTSTRTSWAPTGSSGSN